MLDVSVIIVNWNTKDLLRNCIKSICREAGNISYEVVVVDNASSDGSAEMVKDEFPQVRLLGEQCNRGYAGAINDGIAVAEGRYVLVLNSDTLICDSAIEKTVRCADKHPEAAVVGCQVRESSNNVQMTCFRFPSFLNLFLDTLGLNKIFPRNAFFGREQILWWPRDSERQVDVVSGMYMLVRREAIEQVGPMDESYFLYFEETDWCYRFSKAGWTMLFWPGARIIHVGGGSHSTDQNAVEAYAQFQKSRLLFFKKRYNRFVYSLVWLLVITHTLLRYLYWTMRRFVKSVSGGIASYESVEVKKRRLVLSYLLYSRQGAGVKEKTLMSVRLSGVVKFFFAAVYAVILPFVRKRPYRVVLYYHSIRPRHAENFARQMAWLSKSRCKVVRASQILTAEAGGCDCVLAITFDDAFVSVLENGLPVLRRHGFSASVFTPAGNLGRAPVWSISEDNADRCETVMGGTQLQEIEGQGFEVLSHTLSHLPLTELNDKQLSNELLKSRLILKEILGHEITGVSYPHGSFDERVRRAAERAGYEIGFTIEPSIVNGTTDGLKVGRFEVSAGEPLTVFKLKVAGAYQVLKHLSAVKRLLAGRNTAVQS